MPHVPEYTDGVDTPCVGIDEARRVVYYVVKSGLELLKEDPSWIDRVLVQLSSEEISKIKLWLATVEFSVIHGYARKDAKMPLVSILEINEKDAQSYLNDHIGLDDPELMAAEFLGEVNPFRDQAVIVSGGRIEVQLEAWIYAENPDITHYMHKFVWVLLHSSRDILGKRGITVGSMSGGDVVPDPKFMPEKAYIRRIVLPVSGDRIYGDRDDLIAALTVKVNALLD